MASATGRMTEPPTPEPSQTWTNGRRPKSADTEGVGGGSLATFPLLQNNETAGPFPDNVSSGKGKELEDDKEDEPAVAKPFARKSSPDSVSHAQQDGGPAAARNKGQDEEDEEEGRGGGAGVDADVSLGDDEDDAAIRRPSSHKMHRFSLYETASRFYLVGVDVSEKRYRILKIDKTTDGAELNMTDDKILYTLEEVNQLLDTIDDGNRGSGGVKLRCTTWGLLGFIKFTGPYYMLLITKKSTVAMIGGHYINQIEGTDLIPLTPGRSKLDARNNPEEQRFLAILNTLDLTKSFYYSYSYDITRTLQHNISRERVLLANGKLPQPSEGYNSMFVWNDYLLQPAVRVLSDPYDWCRPIIHGYIDQAALSIYGRTAHITVIARRSRYFAGARFLKRGANDLGYVANDVETEQIVAESLTTSFHAPGPQLYCSPQYTSYVQHRGSIPLYWTQDSTAVTPKPPIELNLVDPFYGAAALHFDNLFERYGSPIYILNLIKSKERQPRESKLLEEYTHAINYLNQFLPEGNKMIHKAWDMSRASKMRGGDVIGNLETIAESVLQTTGFFQNGDGVTSPMTAQNGVARTNCIDCLDRTNAAQFVIGKRALGHQLHALGILENTSVEYDTDAVNLFTHMWHDHGDTIALQYGGSQLVNTMETYRKINQWTSHSRDMIESFKRYYNNSFLDSQRQEAYNLFLGNYIFAQGQPMLWDLSTDYYLHHANPREWVMRKKTNYISWFNPQHLEKRTVPPFVRPRTAASNTIKVTRGRRLSPRLQDFDDYWLEYYRPATLSSFPKMFAYKMNSTIKYIPLKATQDGRYDLSPFRVRKDTDPVDAERKRLMMAKKETMASASSASTPNLSSLAYPTRQPGLEPATATATATARGMSLHRWLQPGGPGKASAVVGTASSDETANASSKMMREQTALEKSNAAQWTFTKAVHESLNPSVSEQEAEDYERYVRHPQNLSLVVSSSSGLEGGGGGGGDDDDDDVEEDSPSAEYLEYVNGSWQDQGLMVMGVEEEEMELYAQLLKVGENPLTVTEEDAPKKRYKAYGKWLRGKSFFKQLPLD